MKSALDELRELSERLDRYDERMRSMRGIFGAIFWTVPNPCWLKAPNGAGDDYWVMAAINRAYERAFKVEASRYVGKSDVAIWGAEIAAGFRANDMLVRDTGKMLRTTELFDLDGNMGPHEVLKWPVYENGIFQGVGGVATGPSIVEWIARNA